jgi:hypothetical protein
MFICCRRYYDDAIIISLLSSSRYADKRGKELFALIAGLSGGVKSAGFRKDWERVNSLYT